MKSNNNFKTPMIEKFLRAIFPKFLFWFFLLGTAALERDAFPDITVNYINTGTNAAPLPVTCQEAGIWIQDNQPSFPVYPAGFNDCFGGGTLNPGDTSAVSFSGGYYQYGWYHDWWVYNGNAVSIAVSNGGPTPTLKKEILIRDGQSVTYDVAGPDDPSDGDRCDRLDLSDCPGCSVIVGMPVWSVSEPYCSLWVRDEPLGYQPSQGSRISFKLAFKQRDANLEMLSPVYFGVGKKWNFSWSSYLIPLNGGLLVHFTDGMERTFQGTNFDYLTNTRLTGDSTNGYTVSYPDGSQDIYNFMITNTSGDFIMAFLSERWNPQSQRTRLIYYPCDPAAPIIKLQCVIDADGRTNSIFYATNNAFSPNLISQVTDPFGRSTLLAYDEDGHLTNIVDVAGNSSSLTYDANGCVSSMTTPYGTTSFSVTDPTTNAPYRSVLISQPDGGTNLFLFENIVNGLSSSYPTNQIPNTSPFSNSFDTTNLNFCDSFYWGPRQYAALTNTTISYFTTNDFLKARMRHWLTFSDTATVGNTLSMQRDPSPDSGGTIEGQKTWYDYTGKSSPQYEGTQVKPLFVAKVLPDGTTRFTHSDRNSLGAVTSEVSTYSLTAGGSALLRTNTFVYDPNGIDLLAQTNALGIQISSNVFNAYHEVCTNYNARGEETLYIYDGSNRLTSITSPTLLVMTNIYGTDGFLTNQIIVGFSTNSYAYSNDLVYTHTDERGLTTTNLYDNLQRLTNSSDSRGAMIYTYSKLDLVQVVDRMKFTNSYVYDQMRRKISETDALGRSTYYNYCNCGSLNSIQDAATNFTHFNYDNQGRRTNTVYADSYSVTNNFNLIGQVTSTVDNGGASITNWFNNQGLQVAVSNAFGQVQATIYDVLDRATNTVDANGVTVTTTFDNLNRPLTRSYPDGGTENFVYTPNFSSLTSYTNQIGNTILYGYDAMNRKTNEITVGVTTNAFGYDGASDLLTLTDGKGQVTTWKHDPFGRVANKLDNLGTNLFIYGYDSDNRLTNRVSAAKGTTVYSYDAVGNLTNVAYPVSPSISMAYDVLNRLTNMVDAVGATIYNYDSVGQLLSEDGPWADDTVNYTYQNRLRTGLSLQAPNASAWSQSYGYDSARRLNSLTSPAGAFTYTLGGANSASPLIKVLSFPNGAYITNTYDSVARMLSTELVNSGASVLDSESYGYNLGSQRTQQVFTAGNFMNYTYDNAGQLAIALGKESGGATNRLQEQFGYAYDAAGNLNFRTNGYLVQTFNVNSLNELTTVGRSGTLAVAGTTTSPATNVTINSLTATLYSDSTFVRSNFTLVDGNNSFTAVGKDGYGRQDSQSITVNLPATNSFAYDLNGNMLTNGTEVMIWNDENELVTNFVAGAWKSEFTYDGKLRRRIERDYKWSGSAWTQTNEMRFIYDGNVIVQHRNANNLPTLTLTRGTDLSGTLQGAGGIGGLLAMTENSLLLNPSSASAAHSYYHADGNGNVTCLVNTSQAIVGKAEYDPFGNFLSLRSSKAGVNYYWFSSKPIHWQSGKYDFVFRWYALQLDRWPTRDPIGEEGGINLYAYVGNDPISRRDDLGLQWIPNLPPPGWPHKSPKDPGWSYNIFLFYNCDCDTGCFCLVKYKDHDKAHTALEQAYFDAEVDDFRKLLGRACCPATRAGFKTLCQQLAELYGSYY